MSIAVQAAIERSSADRPEETRSRLRRNFTLGVVSGVAYNLYLSVLSTQVVMTWFLSELTESNLLISLLLPIEIGGWYFLQLLFSGYVRRRPRVLPLYRAMAAIRVASLALLCLATLILEPSGPLLVVFVAMFTVNSVAAGVAALPFLNVVAKTIPATRRGMYFAWRRFAGGLLGLLGAALVKVVLAPSFALGFPDNYALLFFIGCLITLVLVGSFSLVVEPRGAVEPLPGHPVTGWRIALGRVMRDWNYVHYLGARVAIALANAALPFYTVYARRVLDISGSDLGVYLLGSTLASVLSNLVLGRLGDRYGNRLLVRLAALTAALPPLAALFLDQVGGPALDRGTVFTAVFVFQGLHATAHSIGSNNYLLELGPAAERVTVVSFAHGVIGLAVLASPLGGAIVNWVGFEPLFVLSLVCGLVAVGLSVGLEEPRRTMVVVR
jgi:MFS family permease